MLNQVISKKNNIDPNSTFVMKLSNVNSLIQHLDSNEHTSILKLDQEWLRLQGFCCKTRGQLSEKLLQDIMIRNTVVQKSILQWCKYKQGVLEIQETQGHIESKLYKYKTQEIPSSNTQQNQHSQGSPILKPLTFAFTQLTRKKQPPNISSSINNTNNTNINKEKKIPIQLKSVQCPINNVEFVKTNENKIITQRLHATKLKTIVEIKIMQENRLIVLSNQIKELSNPLYSQKVTNQVDNAYTKFFGTTYRKRAVTICNSHFNETEYYFKSQNIEGKLKTNKF